MRHHHSHAYYAQEQRFNDRFPLSIVAILGIIQMLTTFAIIAFEIGHIVINVRLTNLFTGFWASLPFTILWISMFATVCCCRRRSCATHAVIQNLISFIFAGVLIGINIAFLRRPNDCFLTTGLCNNLSWMNDVNLPFECYSNGGSNGCENTRLALIKAQLAAGVVMAVTCFIYLILYTAISSRVSRASQRSIPTAPTAVMAPVYQQPLPPPITYQHQPYTIPPHSYQPSAPVYMPSYLASVSGNNSMSYFPPNQHQNIYPTIPNDRF